LSLSFEKTKFLTISQKRRKKMKLFLILSLIGIATAIHTPAKCRNFEGTCIYKKTCQNKGALLITNKCPGSSSVICCLDQRLSIQNVCPNLRVARRWDWNARPGKRPGTPLYSIPRQVVIHHSVTAECHSDSACKQSVKNFQGMHMNGNGWNDIGYSFMIGGNGLILEGRGYFTQGAHAGNTWVNKNSIGINLVGNFEYGKSPSDAQVTAAKDLIACLVKAGRLRSDYILRGHRNVKATACPGKNLYKLLPGWGHFTSAKRNSW
jgi:N-acetylmuramoyl-L-alanine amidase